MRQYSALASERLLFPHTRELAASDASVGKALLARPTQLPPPTRPSLTLTPIASPDDWQLYEQRRIEVEDGFGVPPQQARAMVAALRERTAVLELSMFFGRTTKDDVVAAIGYFGRGRWVRLQEVDVFPAWRGRGYGDGLLSATLQHLTDTTDAEVVILGADEDDWPLEWYRRRGFADVARVALTR
ncbi:GNAT family N-acetyltransferase [Kineosporia babensis]|uniref:N-acetyltransferase domain-containing protein n=1 Tax=Kineosporia babensis TaxID=499548 RepID=A0A9X1NHE1_9ACTN|nr:GNAT family N-acetyltransferase [Kineosporia babensis]MCD5313311.1 hypothetical protein [Kineosporia babensis]